MAAKPPSLTATESEELIETTLAAIKSIAEGSESERASFPPDLVARVDELARLLDDADD